MSTGQPTIADILNEAIAFESPEERASFLEQACGKDPELKRRVEELIRNHFRAGNFLEPPAIHIPETVIGPPIKEVIGAQIGPYKLLQEIGEGGMGVVFMAEQKQPVERRVALKIIKPGMDTREVIARFEAEKQALAMMDHPHIAKVFDAGMTESGRPFFVMELINGIPITNYCDEQHLTPPERLKLFLPVCQAVQHAHQKGIIHRDIKPSNVLVAEYDHLAVPKIIDFGVAKATSQHLTERTLFTQLGQVMGTFEYMSPEQAKRNQLDVDTRTDIYSLGVLLYELLTGETPFDSRRIRAAALDEILKIIREEEPQKPSTRLSGSESLASVAANRKIEPARLSKFVRGDLDWIVMKALEKDRARRYETATSLAADLQHFLDNEPVVARPPSSAYRFRKFAHRNAAALVMASLIAILLVVGTIVSTWQAIRATQAERRANEQSELATQNAAEATESRNLADAERVRAEDRELAARRSRYQTNMMLARDAWNASDVSMVEERLNVEMPEPGVSDIRTFAWYYLWHQSHRERMTFHTGAIWNVAFSPDGKLIATAGKDRTIKLWSVADGQERYSLIGHSNEINSVTFSPNGELLASAADDQTARLWNPASGALLGSLEGHRGAVCSVAFTPDGKQLVTAGADGMIKIWDPQTRQDLAVLGGHTKTVHHVAFTRDGRFLASCGADSTVKIWNFADRKQHSSLSGHTGDIRYLAFSPDGAWLATAGIDMTIKLWDVVSSRELATLTGHSRNINAVEFSPDGSLLASASADKSVRIWDSSKYAHVATIKCSGGGARSIAFSPDGTLLATATASTAKLWTVPSPKQFILQGHTATAYTVAFSPDGKLLASGGWDGLVKLWDVSTGRELFTLSGHKRPVLSVNFSPDGGTLSTAGSDRVIKLWDLGTRQVRLELPGHSATIQKAIFSPHGRVLASSGDEIKIWDVATGHESATITGHKSQDGLAFFPDGTRIATSGRDGKVRLWDIATQRELATLDGGGGGVRAVAVSPDGATIATGNTDETVKLWDAATGKVSATLRGHSGVVQGVAFSVDGSFLVSVSSDHTARLWDLKAGLAIAVLTGHTARIDGVSISRDRKKLATASEDKTVRLWDIDARVENEH